MHHVPAGYGSDKVPRKIAIFCVHAASDRICAARPIKMTRSHISSRKLITFWHHGSKVIGNDFILPRSVIGFPSRKMAKFRSPIVEAVGRGTMIILFVDMNQPFFWFCLLSREMCSLIRVERHTLEMGPSRMLGHECGVVRS